MNFFGVQIFSRQPCFWSHEFNFLHNPIIVYGVGRLLYGVALSDSVIIISWNITQDTIRPPVSFLWQFVPRLPHAKSSLIAWVSVIPKKRHVWFLLVWHRFFLEKKNNKKFFSKKRKKKKADVTPKEDWACCMFAYPSFGMTLTQAIRDLFAWCLPPILLWKIT